MEKEKFNKLVAEAITKTIREKDVLLKDTPDPEEKVNLAGEQFMFNLGGLLAKELDPEDEEANLAVFVWLEKYLITDCDFDPDDEELAENAFYGMYVQEVLETGSNEEWNTFLKSIH